MAAAFDAMKMERRALAMLDVLLKHQNSLDIPAGPAGMKVREIIDELHKSARIHLEDVEVNRLIKRVNGWSSGGGLTIIEKVPARSPKRYILNRGLPREFWDGLATLAFAVSFVRYAEVDFRSAAPDPKRNFHNMTLLLVGLQNATFFRVTYNEEGRESTTMFRPENIKFHGGWLIVGSLQGSMRPKEISLRKIRLVENVGRL